jgi:hypothetical protein
MILFCVTQCRICNRTVSGSKETDDRFFYDFELFSPFLMGFRAAHIDFHVVKLPSKLSVHMLMVYLNETVSLFQFCSRICCQE